MQTNHITTKALPGKYSKNLGWWLDLEEEE